MTLTLPEVRIGKPQRFEALSVFPLFTKGNSGVDYLLSDEAFESEALVVEEVSEQGSVSDLLVENKGDTRVLFLEGEELIGAKQNRIINTSILIAAKSKTRIPVSCVEQGRWGYKSRRFASGGRHSPSKLRHALKSGVARSLKAKKGYTSDQGEVWSKVAEYDQVHCVASPTAAMSDTFEALEKRTTEGQEQLNYVDGATGVAVALGKKIVAVELFDKATTCRKIWGRMLSGFIVDALEERPEKEVAKESDVEQVLGATREATWDQVDPIGEGEEYRAEVAQDPASALCFEDELVHGSVIAV